MRINALRIYTRYYVYVRQDVCCWECISTVNERFIQYRLPCKVIEREKPKNFADSLDHFQLGKAFCSGTVDRAIQNPSFLHGEWTNYSLIV
jgi:hypothetical protein